MEDSTSGDRGRGSDRLVRRIGRPPQAPALPPAIPARSPAPAAPSAHDGRDRRPAQPSRAIGHDPLVSLHLRLRAQPAHATHTAETDVERQNVFTQGARCPVRALRAFGLAPWVGEPFWTDRTGPCHPGSISVTSDGGRTSRVLVRTSGPVIWVATAPKQQAWAVVRICGPAGCWPRLWHSIDGGASWRAIGSARFETASFADAEHGLSIRNPGKCASCPRQLLATGNGGRTWHRRSSPCHGAEQSVSLVTRMRGWLHACVRSRRSRA